MNFFEANAYRDTYMFLIGTKVDVAKFPFEVEHLAIAPVNRDPLDRMKIFGMSFGGVIANESALRKFNFQNEDLSVYVLGVNNNIRYHIPLKEYLLETRQAGL